jgi:hypothetical protein
VIIIERLITLRRGLAGYYDLTQFSCSFSLSLLVRPTCRKLITSVACADAACVGVSAITQSNPSCLLPLLRSPREGLFRSPCRSNALLITSSAPLIAYKTLNARSDLSHLSHRLPSPGRTVVQCTPTDPIDSFSQETDDSRVNKHSKPRISSIRDHTNDLSRSQISVYRPGSI